MSYIDDLLEPDDEENGQNPELCMGDPFTCPCESCLAFRIDLKADRAGEIDDGHNPA